MSDETWGWIVLDEPEEEFGPPNIPMLRKAVEWAEAEAAKPYAECQWYQADYVLTPENMRAEFEEEAWKSCGTCYCIAGYVAWQALGDVEDLSIIAHKEAQKILGLSSAQANHLFNGGNDIQAVRRIAEHIAGEAL